MPTLGTVWQLFVLSTELILSLFYDGGAKRIYGYRLTLPLACYGFEFCICCFDFVRHFLMKNVYPGIGIHGIPPWERGIWVWRHETVGMRNRRCRERDS